MGFAEAVDCPVVLIADIDRGGVFAHLVGTLDLLSKTEQDRVVGFIINRFRGDISLLQSGLDWLEERTGKPVLGVVPYFQDFFLDAEDAIANSQIVSNKKQAFKIVVPVLPRISNHTDFDALRMHPDVDLEFVSVKQPCPNADLIILPGSKNVLGDLLTLKESGWQNSINKHLRYGGKVIGICGGYQMLGHTLNDHHGIESSLKTQTGFNLLDITTELEPEKQLQKASGSLIADGFGNIEITGYEIHCGVSHANTPLTSLLSLNSNQKHSPNRDDGFINDDNNVLGTYLHGLFDQPEACNALLKWAGLETSAATDLNVLRESQLDRLADCLQTSLDDSFWDSFEHLSQCNVSNKTSSPVS